jgi:membrane protein
MVADARKSGLGAGPPREDVEGRRKDPDRPRNILLVIVERISNDNLTLIAAGVAFYALLALFPALAILVSLYGIFANPSQIAGQIESFGKILPPESMKLLTDFLRTIVSAGTTKHNIALATSLALSLWSANSATSSMIAGLNIAYRSVDQRSVILQYAISLLITVCAIVVALLALAALAVLPSIASLMSWNTGLPWILAVVRWPFLGVILLLSIGVLYRFGAYRRDPEWRWITWGSASAMAGWLAASALFSFYVAHFGSYDVTYGSLGAVIVLLLWFWVGALAALAGAEVDAELEMRSKTADGLRQFSRGGLNR